MSLLLFFAVGPAILLGPIAGAIVDRRSWNMQHQLILPFLACFGLLAFLLAACGGAQPPAPVTPHPTAAPPEPGVRIHYKDSIWAVYTAGELRSILERSPLQDWQIREEFLGITME